MQGHNLGEIACAYDQGSEGREKVTLPRKHYPPRSDLPSAGVLRSAWTIM